MKRNWKLLLTCVAVPLAVGGLSAWLSGGGMDRFVRLNKPLLSLPGWIFPVVWTILYVLMGLASYLILTSEQDQSLVGRALRVYGIQLGVNFFWSILFFRWSLYLVAFIWLVLLWGLILVTMGRFERISRLAGRLMLPYLLWVTFAGYLNFAIYLLN